MSAGKYLGPILAADDVTNKDYVDQAIAGAAGNEIYIGATQPTDPKVTMWYDTSQTTVYAQGPTAFAQVETTAPTPRGVGDLWVDSSAPLLTWDDAWIIPPLLNGWTNYLTNFAPARYRKVASGQVEVQGLVAGGTGVVFTLPVGYRPTGSLIFATMASANLFSRLDITYQGNVLTTLVGAATNGWFSISCTFFADS